MKAVYTELQSVEEQEYETYDEIHVEEEVREDGIKVYTENDEFIVDGPYIDKLLRSTNFEDRDSLRYFQENLRKNGVVEKLKELGVGEGDSVFIGDYEFEFFE